MKRRAALPPETLRAWLSHPILGRLRREAPGTHYHSGIVATIAERGAAALGLDALYVQTGARFHDIGKLYRPELFQENQRASDPLAEWGAVERARAIIAHVREGLALAKSIRLPEELACFIAEHHGRRVLRGLYEEARAAATDGNPPSLADFTYPGPWPQSAETAVVLFADAAEAGARVRPPGDTRTLAETLAVMGSEFAAAGSFDEVPWTEAHWRALADAFAVPLAAALEA
ncbi:MAG: HDIG domain-containing protein [Myxococcales bacterium]|nr:HDIG domain-containing protein [Myxococcales bacterium]